MPPRTLEVATVSRRGPYATLALRGELSPSQPGQFYMLRGEWGLEPFLGRPLSILGEELARGEVRFLVKAVGEGSRRLCEAKPGDRIQALGPLGNHFPLDFPPGSRVVAVGGGVGVPPLVYLSGALLPKGVKVTFLQGARTAEDLLLAEELGALGVDLKVTTEDGSAGTRGLVTALLDEALASGPAAVCACGPDGMMRAVGKTCLGKVPCYLSLEAQMGCGYGVCLSCVTRVAGEDGAVKNQRVCKEGPVFRAEVLPWL